MPVFSPHTNQACRRLARARRAASLLFVALALTPLAAPAQTKTAQTTTAQTTTAQTAPADAAHAAPTPPEPAADVAHGRREGPTGGDRGGDRGGNRARSATPDDEATSDARLPADETTRHTLDLPGRSLSFVATAGSVPVTDESGAPQAHVAYIYYRLETPDAARRPLVFLFNGGPGSASAWLQLGAVGPWRIAMEAGPGGEAPSPSAPPELLPNAETWLDFADLVFVDPAGTGFSRFAGKDEGARKSLLSVDGDARAVAQAIRRIVVKSDRALSPKYIVGESYGGIRGPRVLRDLTTREGVGVRGLVLISPVLDFRPNGGDSLLQYVWSLPSMAAAARARKGPVRRADLADVESYAGAAMIADLLAGEADKAATARLVERVAAFTALDPAFVRQVAGRVSTREFRREFDRAAGRIAGAYDASVSGLDPFPDSSVSMFSDPSAEPFHAPLTSAAVELTTRRLGWRAKGAYRLGNNAVNRAWNWGGGLSPPESLTQLRQSLAADPKLKVLVAHGLFDLVTPYFGSKILLAQLPDFGGDRVRLTTYPGGHMFYSREASRRAFRDEVAAMMR